MIRRYVRCTRGERLVQPVQPGRLNQPLFVVALRIDWTDGTDTGQYSPVSNPSCHSPNSSYFFCVKLRSKLCKHSRRSWAWPAIPLNLLMMNRAVTCPKQAPLLRVESPRSPYSFSSSPLWTLDLAALDVGNRLTTINANQRG